MLRKLFTKRMVLLLVMAALILGGGASWLTRGPREPVLHGKPLSWWFSEGLRDQGTPTPRRLTAEELRGLEPEALAWLSHKAAQTSIWEEEYSASPKNMRVRLYWWMRGRWFDRLASRAEHVRFEAVVALRKMGPDAAPAVPSLLKATENLNSDTRSVAAKTLLEMGSVSWPAVADAMRHGKRRTQGILLYQMDLRWTPNTQPAISPEKFTEIVEFLIPLTLDSDQ